MNIIAKASFSICEYFFPTDSKALDACAIGLVVPSVILRRMQAPMPYELASLATMISKSGLSCVRNNSDVRIF